MPTGTFARARAGGKRWSARGASRGRARRTSRALVASTVATPRRPVGVLGERVAGAVLADGHLAEEPRHNLVVQAVPVHGSKTISGAGADRDAEGSQGQFRDADHQDSAPAAVARKSRR